MNPLQTLSSFIAETSPVDVPSAVSDYGRRIVVDSIASATASLGTDSVRIIRSASDFVGEGSSTVFGNGRGNILHAILTNSAAITGSTVCDIYQPLLLHVSPSVVPPALAIAEREGCSFSELVDAVLLGIESEIRIGLAFDYDGLKNRGWHSPGVFGPFGSAAACARLLGLPARQTMNALSLAGSSSAGTFAVWGTAGVKWHQARSAWDGLMAAMLAKEGFESGNDVLCDPNGGLLRTYAGGGDAGAILQELGEKWFVLDLALRKYPVASSLQSLAQVCLDLSEDVGATRFEIRNCSVELSERTFALHGSLPWDSPFSSRLSAPYVAASCLLRGVCWLPQFEYPEVVDDRLQAFIGRDLTIVSNSGVPDFGAKVTVELDNGRVLSASRDDAPGAAAEKLDWQDISVKLAASCGISGSTAEGFISKLRQPEHNIGVRALLDELNRMPPL